MLTASRRLAHSASSSGRRLRASLAAASCLSRPATAEGQQTADSCAQFIES
jgi:hypothetical protein